MVTIFSNNLGHQGFLMFFHCPLVTTGIGFIIVAPEGAPTDIGPNLNVGQGLNQILSRLD